MGALTTTGQLRQIKVPGIERTDRKPVNLFKIARFADQWNESYDVSGHHSKSQAG
jgi:hypothetical protein